MRVFLSAALTAIWLSVAGCGYVGPTHYPALKIPSRITDLSAVERGHEIDVYFTAPALTTEGLAITGFGSMDLRAGPENTQPFNLEHWAEAAMRFPQPPPAKPGSFHTTIPIDSWAGKDVIIAVRLANAKGRQSPWSNLVTVSVQMPLRTPADLKAEPGRGGVRLTWTAPGEHSFRIFRQAEGQALPTQIATSDKSEYLDSMVEFGKTYRYYVQGLDGKTESDAAGPVSATPQDIYPPSIPMGLAATNGLDAIELAWEPNPESDLAGYRIYRAEGDGPLQLLADMITTPQYSDRKVESGKRYRYAISAVARNGHESPQSAPVEAVAP